MAAFAAPAKTERHIFLSCGTWSLFGTELEQPVLTEQWLRWRFPTKWATAER
ncbi:MAG: hypothetical protein ACLR5S_11465 [Ruminococcus sp.]